MAGSLILELLDLFTFFIRELITSDNPTERFIGYLLLLLGFIGLIVVVNLVITFLQDLGYSIKTGDKNTGLITAESTAKSNAAMKIWLGITEVSQTTADAFIEDPVNTLGEAAGTALGEGRFEDALVLSQLTGQIPQQS